MSRSKSELSLTQRLLIDYVKFKTNNNHKFFAKNDKIAQALDLTEASAKVMINTLIRKGYLIKQVDEHGRRYLSYSGKEYKPLFENMQDVDKKVLKQEMEYHKNWHIEYEKQLARANRDNEYFQDELMKVRKRVWDLEYIFYVNGCTPEQLDEIIKQAKEQKINIPQ